MKLVVMFLWVNWVCWFLCLWILVVFSMCVVVVGFCEIRLVDEVVWMMRVLLSLDGLRFMVLILLIIWMFVGVVGVEDCSFLRYFLLYFGWFLLLLLNFMGRVFVRFWSEVDFWRVLFFSVCWFSVFLGVNGFLFVDGFLILVFLVFLKESCDVVVGCFFCFVDLVWFRVGWIIIVVLELVFLLFLVVVVVDSVWVVLLFLLVIWMFFCRVDDLVGFDWNLMCVGVVGFGGSVLVCLFFFWY